MRAATRWLLLVFAASCIGAGLLVLLAVGLPQRADYTGYALDGLRYAPEIGSLAPPFTTSSLTGEFVDLLEFRGQVVVLNFWATWCAPCEAELPILQAFADQMGDQVRVVAVNLREDGLHIQPWLAARQLTLPIGLDVEGNVAALYQLRGQPSTYIIAPDGQISAIFYGPISAEALRAATAPLLSLATSNHRSTA